MIDTWVKQEWKAARQRHGMTGDSFHHRHVTGSHFLGEPEPLLVVNSRLNLHLTREMRGAILISRWEIPTNKESKTYDQPKSRLHA